MAGLQSSSSATVATLHRIHFALLAFSMSAHISFAVCWPQTLLYFSMIGFDFSFILAISAGGITSTCSLVLRNSDLRRDLIAVGYPLLVRRKPGVLLDWVVPACCG
jgi:hypothetical protein